MSRVRLTLGYVLDGEETSFTAEVEAWRDRDLATRELQLKLMADVLALEPWVITREQVVEAGLPEGLHFDGEFTIRDAQDHPWVSIHESGNRDPEEWREAIIRRVSGALEIPEFRNEP